MKNLNISNETTHLTLYGGIEFFLSNLNDYLPYTILTIIGTISGTLDTIVYFKSIKHLY